MAPKSTPARARSAPAHATEFRRRLLRWFRRHGRDLPWRRTRDPYHVTVAEFMLQQTQVTRVEAYYHRFLDRYPTVESLARSDPAMVREAWAGLGYYRRAANLHLLAQTVVAEHAGIIPSDPERLLALPGVGPYATAQIMMLLGRYSRLILDSWSRPKYAKVTGRKAGDKTIERRFGRYKQYAGLAFWLYVTRDWVAEPAGIK